LFPSFITQVEFIKDKAFKSFKVGKNEIESYLFTDTNQRAQALMNLKIAKINIYNIHMTH
jgi:hypothetical protein